MNDSFPIVYQEKGTSLQSIVCQYHLIIQLLARMLPFVTNLRTPTVNRHELSNRTLIFILRLKPI